MQENIFFNYRDKSLIFKKYIIYIDIIIKEGEFIIGQKLNSFFGQVGIFENTEEIVEYVESYYKSILLKNYVFGEFDLKEYEILKDFVLYLPLTMIFYFGDKKVDFYIYSSWSKNLINKNIRSLYIKNFNVLNKYKSLVLNKINFYKKLLNYNSLISSINRSNFYHNRFSILNKKMFLNFFITEDFHTLFFDEYIDYFIKKKNRSLFFKKIKVKNKKLLFSLNKNVFNIDSKFIIYLLLTKLSFFENEFHHSDLFFNYLTFVSNLYSFKKNFLKRFRRKKKFKKKLIKNIFGKKFNFFKIFNSIEIIKKKKRK